MSEVDPEQWSVVEMTLGTELVAAVCGPFDDGHSDERLAYLLDLLRRLRGIDPPAWFRNPGPDGHAPVAVLTGAWRPTDPDPTRLRDALPAPRR